MEGGVVVMKTRTQSEKACVHLNFKRDVLAVVIVSSLKSRKLWEALLPRFGTRVILSRSR